MARSDRYTYMADPRHNPPNDDCPDCPEPSRKHHQGARTVVNDDGSHTAITRWECDNGHTWKTKEDRPS